MASNKLPFANRAIVLGSHCAGSVRYYAAMLAAGRVIIDSSESKLPLRHSHHRYTIDGANGPQLLTVPLAKDTNVMAATISQVRLSEHDNWRARHWGALFSTYGRSPYFDFVADELKAVVMGNQTHLLQFNTQMQSLIINFLDLPIEIDVREVADNDLDDAVDLRKLTGGKRHDALPIADVPYYQVWQERSGFKPNLSILDLMMNEGREAIFTLKKMAGD